MVPRRQAPNLTSGLRNLTSRRARRGRSRALAVEIRAASEVDGRTYPSGDPGHDDPATTVPETCRVLGISKSSYYAALRA
jgi:hypothetical protein